VIREAGDGEAALAAVRRLRPDVVLMDIQVD
jgi:CheY-like chemotaxis protein